MVNKYKIAVAYSGFFKKMPLLKDTSVIFMKGTIYFVNLATAGSIINIITGTFMYN